MSLTVIHGENNVQSRQKLVELETAAKAMHHIIKHLSARTLTPAALEVDLRSLSLFAEDQILVLEELHSLPKSARQTQLIQMLAQTQSAVILWEKRALTKTMLGKLKNPVAWEYRVSSSLFKWLDSLSAQAQTKTAQIRLFHQALNHEDEQLCFIMLIRQVRLLLQAKEGGDIKGPPFMITKLKKQARNFSTEQLLSLHSQVLQLDLNQKTSQAWQSLRQELDILIFRL